jgi:hypothetical protein
MHASTPLPFVEYGGSSEMPHAGALLQRASSIRLHKSMPVALVPQPAAAEKSAATAAIHRNVEGRACGSKSATT